MQISDQCGEQKTLRFLPERVPAGPFALGVGHQGRDQFQNVLLAVDISEGIIVHGLFEIDGVQDFKLVAIFQKCVPALDYDTTFWVGDHIGTVTL